MPIHPYLSIYTYIYLFYLILSLLYQIYDLETNYLEETRDLGSIFSGWDLFLARGRARGRKQVGRDERLFSLSSATSPASLREDAKRVSN